MSLLSGITDFIGLTDSEAIQRAADSAQFNPYNIQSSYGNLNYDPTSRLFTSQLSPELQAMQQQILGQYSQISPEQQLGLYRQQAQPYNQAQSQGLENRLFSQGRLDHSQVYGEGGAMRGLFDAQANQDLQFQQMAQQQAQQAQTNYMNQYMGIAGLDAGLFNAGMGMGNIGAQGQIAGAGIQAQGSMFNSQMGYNVFNDIMSGVTSMFGGGIGG